MLYGTWSERKPNGSLSIDNLFVGDVGVFVDGTEYKGSISQLTGTATYEGNVKFTKYNTNSNYYRSLCGTSCEGFSLYQATTETEAKRLVDIHKRYNDGFALGDTLEGNMILKADFEDTNSLGYVSGEINNFKDKQIVSYENIGTSNNPNYALTFDTVNLPGKLNLDRLSIGSTHSGFFDGNLQGNINRKNYSGRWGGQFYSYDSNDYPTHIAGTLAASSGNFNIIAPWFISNKEKSASLLPIHFRPPQEDNPGIGLIPSPNPTPTPSPDDPIHELAYSEYTYYGSINGFNYKLNVDSINSTVDFPNNKYFPGSYDTGYNIIPDFRNTGCLGYCPSRINAKYSSDDGFIGYYKVTKIGQNSYKPEDFLKDVEGKFTTSVDINLRLKIGENGYIPESLSIDLGSKKINNLELIRENYGISITPKFGEDFYQGRFYKNNGNFGDFGTQVRGGFSNDGTKSDFPSYVGGMLRNKEYKVLPDTMHNGKLTRPTFITETTGVFLAELEE